MKLDYFKTSPKQNVAALILAPLFLIFITPSAAASAIADDNSEADYSAPYVDEITKSAKARYAYANEMANNREFKKIKSDIDSAASAENNPAFLQPNYPDPYLPRDCAHLKGLLTLELPDKSRGVPDGPVFTAACNAHSRDYARLGMSKALVDEKLLKDLNLIVDAWLEVPIEVKEQVITTEVRVVEDIPFDPVAAGVANVIKVETPRPLPISSWPFGGIRQVGEPIQPRKRTTHTETVNHTKTITKIVPRRLADLTWHPTLRKEVQDMYEAIRSIKNPKTGRLISDESFEQAQSDARSFHQWLMFYFALHPIEK